MQPTHQQGREGVMMINSLDINTISDDARKGQERNLLNKFHKISQHMVLLDKERQLVKVQLRDLGWGAV